MNHKDRPAAENQPLGADKPRKVLGEAVAHPQAGRAQQAGPLYDRVLAAFPDQPDAHNNLGQLLSSTGRTDEAIAALRKACELAPDFAGA